MAGRVDAVPLGFDTCKVFCYICKGLMGALLGFDKRGDFYAWRHSAPHGSCSGHPIKMHVDHTAPIGEDAF